MAKGGVTDNGKEILDVVDENDQIIGQMTKKEVHEGKGILHREIGVVIYDTSGNLLLQQRSFKKRYFPGMWTIATAGHVMAGQTPEEAAHMELAEELGFDTQLKFVEKRKYITGDHKAWGYMFVGEFPRGVMIDPDRDEVENAKFVSKADAIKMMERQEIDYHAIETITKYFEGKFNT